MTARVTDQPAGSLRVDIVDTGAEVGRAAAIEMLDVITAAAAIGRDAVLGCPAGRTPRSAYAALGALAGERHLDLSGIQIVMMDEFVVDGGDGFRRCPGDAHFSCRRAAELDLRRTVNDQLPVSHQIGPAALHVPDPADPAAYDRLITELGGIDLFVLASGASDGHVAFNPPGSSIDEGTHIVRLAESTRHDNRSTFPGFASIDEVPRHGVSVGLGTIARSSRRVVLLLIGAAKHESFRRVVGTSSFDPAWPATLVHRCREARVVADRAAADGSSHGH